MPGHVMETPNQPIGDSMQILTLWTKFFAARPGHWGGWEPEPNPVISEIRFADRERTKASARVTIGYSGGTVELEKENGRWGGMMCGRCADNHESAVQHKPLRWGGLP